MTRRSTAGITLIELLVSISLLSLLSVGMLFAIRIGMNSMQKANDHLMSNRRVMGVDKIFAEQLAGFMPVKADCPGPTTVPFFQGDPDTMRFVSSYSLQEGSRGYPRILEYHIIPGEQGRGVRLIVNEFLYTGPISTGRLCVSAQPVPQFLPVQIGAFSFVLADKLAYCRLIYKEILPGTTTERWLPKWIKPNPPVAIRIEMGPLEPDPSRLQLLDVTALIRVTRDVMTRYGD
jgi:general secretion pathway protein J